MKLLRITTNHITSVAKLCAICFIDDPFYKDLSPDYDIRAEKLTSLFAKSLSISIKYGVVYGHIVNDAFVSFAIWVDYHRLKRESITDFEFVFKGEGQPDLAKVLCSESNVIDLHLESCKKCLFLLAIGVSQSFRKRGLGQQLIEVVTKAYPQYNLFSDISNKDSLKIYQNLNFKIVGMFNNLYFVKYVSKSEKWFLDNNIIFLAVPLQLNISFLEYVDKGYTILENIICDSVNKGFVQSIFFKTKVKIIQIKYSELLKYQRLINLLYYDEVVYFDKKENRSIICYCFEEKVSVDDRFVFDPKANEQELNLIPDCMISIPVEYNCIDCLKNNSDPIPSIIEKTMLALDFRTNYESGIPVEGLENKGFKDRIERYYLGIISIQIVRENQLSFNDISDDVPIGSNVNIGLIISIDKYSKCGVLHMISLSCGLMITQLLDSISRNQIIVETSDGNLCNLYFYIKQNFNLCKKGSAKSFITFSQNRDTINDDILSSLLFCETFYNDGEALGKVVDRDISEKLIEKYGIAQYNYACVYSYTNTVIQISSVFQDLIDKRISQESITLFYIELILFEESAINILDNKIVKFLNNIDDYSPNDVLKDINVMISDFVKTSDFWDIQMNYPSTKRSIDEIRKGFGVDRERLVLKSHKEYLMDIYNTRNDIVNKSESYVISLLGAILTALSAATYFKDGTWNTALLIVVSVILLLYGVRKMVYNTIKKNNH